MSADARAEAERRWAPIPTRIDGGDEFRRGFEQGAEWQASRPVTDAEVEAAARAVLDNFHAPDDGHSSWWLNPEAVARAALEAAREVCS